MLYEVYLTDAKYDTVKIRADDWRTDQRDLVFIKNGKINGKIIGLFILQNIKGFIEVEE